MTLAAKNVEGKDEILKLTINSQARIVDADGFFEDFFDQSIIGEPWAKLFIGPEPITSCLDHPERWEVFMTKKDPSLGFAFHFHKSGDQVFVEGFTVNNEYAVGWRSKNMSSLIHDLRGLLLIIKGYSEILEEDDIDQETANRSLQKITKSVDHMTRILENVSLSNSLDSGKSLVEPGPYPLEDSIKLCVEKLADRFSAEGFPIVIETKGTIPKALIDPDRIQTVISVLLENAKRFAKDPFTIQIVIEENEDFIQTDVIDKGPGIQEGELVRLFKPFGRTSNRSSSGEKGTGLGLTIAKQIMTSHGGDIWCHSEPNKGSTFSFTVPKFNRL